MTTKKKAPPQTVELYHRAGVRLGHYGIAGPHSPAEVPEKMAKEYIKGNPAKWSLEPFNEINKDVAKAWLNKEPLIAAPKEGKQ